MIEGDQNKWIYIVKEGEFRGIKRVVRKNESEADNGYK
jgi:CRP-like cAMP-binding protein